MRQPPPGNFDWMPGHESGEAFLVATGESLKGFDWSRLHGRTVMAVNYAAEFAPHKYHVFLDAGYLKHLKLTLPEVRYIIGPTVPLEPKGNITKVRTAAKPSLHPRTGFYSSFATGLFALNAAIVLGFSKIYLLGYDCTDQGLTHFFDSKSLPGYFKGGGKRYDFARKFDVFAPWRDRIVNLSPVSKITTFPKGRIEDVT